LTWSQGDFTTETIDVVGKEDKPHTLPIPPDPEDLLRPLVGHHLGSVFTHACKRTRRCARAGRDLVWGTCYPITEQGLATHMRRTIVKAGIEGLRPMHDFRHTAATRTLRATGNLRLVNHASPAKYAHATLEDLREGMSRAAADSLARRSKSRTGEMEGVQVLERAIGIEPTTFSLGSWPNTWNDPNFTFEPLTNTPEIQ
jgi:integrase